MAAVLPVVNSNESSEIVEILQKEIDENIARENEQQEMMEQQTGLLKNQNFMINIANEHLESIRSTIANMFDLMSSAREDRMERQETGAIRADIAEERGADFDASGSVRADTDLFDMANLDSGMIGNILGGAVLAYIYGVDDIIQGAVGLLNPGVYVKAAKGLLNTMILKPISAIGNAAKSLGLVKEIQKIIQGPMQVIRRVMATFSRGISTFTNLIRSIAGPLGKFSKILRPLLGPFTLAIFGVIDFIRGFVNGFKEGGFLKGLQEGMGELLAGLVGVPLDLVKDLSAWVARKFGWENVSKELEDFSFAKMIKDTFDGLIEFFKGLFADPVKTLRGLVFDEDDEDLTEEEKQKQAEEQAGDRSAIEEKYSDELEGMSGPARQEFIKKKMRQGAEIEMDDGLRETGKQVGQQSEEQAVNKQQGGGGISGATVVAPSDNSTNIQNSSKVTYQGHPAARPSDHSYKDVQKGWLW